MSTAVNAPIGNAVEGVVGSSPDADTLFAEFEALRLDPAQFSHRTHLHVAWIYLQRFGFAEGGARFTARLREYVAAVGAQAKYHETITWAYLALLNEERELRGAPGETFDDVLSRRPDLLDHRSGALAAHYSRSQLDHPDARRVFQLPRPSLLSRSSRAESRARNTSGFE